MSKGRRSFPSSSSIGRKGASIEPKEKIIVVCEGRNTEPAYLNEFTHFYGNSLVILDVVDAAGVPKTIVDKAIDRKNEQTKKARKSPNSFDKKFQTWAVFDRDQHPGIPEAKHKASANDVKVAMSNPCIEIWGIFHYESHTAHIHSHAAQKKLKLLMTGFDHNKGARFNFNEIKDKYDIAKVNAEHVEQRHQTGDSPIDSNPSSNIYELLDEIKKYGKET